MDLEKRLEEARREREKKVVLLARYVSGAEVAVTRTPNGEAGKVVDLADHLLETRVTDLGESMSLTWDDLISIVQAVTRNSRGLPRTHPLVRLAHGEEPIRPAKQRK